MLTPEAQALLDTITISEGSHTLSFSLEDEERKLCIMEATALIAGFPVNYDPPCSSETIIGFMIDLNDTRTNPDDLERLKGLVPELIGTCPTKMGMNVIRRNYTKGYEAAEGRRQRRLAKELDALGLVEVEWDGHRKIHWDKLTTEEGIRIARIMIGIKNKV